MKIKPIMFRRQHKTCSILSNFYLSHSGRRHSKCGSALLLENSRQTDPEQQSKGKIQRQARSGDLQTTLINVVQNLELERGKRVKTRIVVTE